MGLMTSKAESLEPTPVENNPYIWAIRDPEVLDWRQGLRDNEVRTMSKQHARLPVMIGKASTGLFLGDAKCARDIPRLKSLGIQCIVNVAGEASKHYDLDEDYLACDMHVLRLSAEDEEGYPMLERHLNTVRTQIKEWRAVIGAETKILVHCTAGINRSGVLVAALLMESENMVVLEAVKHIRSRRGNCFLWNESFQEQLVAYARKLNLLGALPPDASHLITCSMEKKGTKKNRLIRDLF
jgi:protein-tyrosine phosphatase